MYHRTGLHLSDTLSQIIHNCFPHSKLNCVFQSVINLGFTGYSQCAWERKRNLVANLNNCLAPWILNRAASHC